MGLLLQIIPLIAVFLLFMAKQNRSMHIISLTASSLLLIIGTYLTGNVLLVGVVEYPLWGNFFYVDALSIIILDIIVFIGFIVSIYSIGYMEEEIKEGKLAKQRLKVYYLLMYSFLFTMILALTVKSMGLMWIAIEATTLASAFLVGFYSDKNALEAAWKYVIICSVGIAIALLGITLLNLSSLNVLDSNHFLDWTALYDHAESLQNFHLRLAFIFILIGFGTKAGLAPMHTWLPDAHSQAPSPISALLSGVLLNSAMYGIIRTVAIVNRNEGSSVYTGRLLIVIGLLSIATASVFILTQKDYKRLLAYSSIEHMGIIAVAIGVFTPVSVFGAILHMINHSLTKSMLFLSSGIILQRYKTKQISQVKALLKILPVSGTVFLLGLFAIAGTPPFSIFTSEISIITSIFEGRFFGLGAIFILLIALVFAGIAVNLFKMFYGVQKQDDQQVGEHNIPGTVCLAVLLLAVTITGFFIPEEIRQLINQAQSIIIGK